ncbi:MAG: prolyl-tRNA synthetase associated domain-containing protein [Bacilli bacterium]|nr:prolyl-tRNA synthetase associated domain-containing protein [Bacilli bacterium]
MIYISDISTEAPLKVHNKTEEKVYKIFQKLNIEFERIENEAVEAMEECVEIDKVLGTEIRKSIFLCNQKKTSFFLVVLPANKSLDTNLLSQKIGVSKLSFASAEAMKQHLGQQPGAASVMGLINDEDEYVELILDKEVAEEEWFGCNPGTNEAHLKIKTEDLLKKFLPHIYHKATIVEL